MTKGMKTGIMWGVIGLAALAGIIAIIKVNSGPQQQSAIPDTMTVTDRDWVKGNAESKVIITEYSDFQCPACKSYESLIEQVVKELGSRSRFVYRHFPLSIHKNAQLASQASEAAGKQGKFWEMHDLLFDRQSDWSEKSDPKDLFVEYAGFLELNKDQFKTDMTSSDVINRVKQATDSGIRAGVNATPTFFVNGVKMEPQPKGLEDFKKAVDEAEKKVQAQAPAPTPVAAAEEPEKKVEAYHTHADIALYVLGNKFDFSQDKYQSKEGKELDQYVHLHDGNGEVFHVHKEGVTLGQFLKSLGITLESNCITLDDGKKMCNDTKNTLKVMVNGAIITDPANYAPKDLDRILVSFGVEDQKALQTQIGTVTDKACIYSEKCPERGTPPTENCVGGVGTVCE